MTLTEYLNQENPVRQYNVELKEGEYELGLKIGNEQQVFIPAINNLLKDHVEYVKKTGGNALWSRDEDGKPTRLSCFYIPNKIEVLIHRSEDKTETWVPATFLRMVEASDIPFRVEVELSNGVRLEGFDAAHPECVRDVPCNF